MTGYGYKARDVDKTTVDWAGITKKISDDLIAEEDRREKLKFEIDKNLEEQLNKIENYPQGLDEDVNVWAQKQAQSSKKMLLERHKLMKSGLVSVNDTKLYKTRVTNTWDNISNGLKSYNENFKRISEAKGKANEALSMEMGKFADISKTTIYYDSTGAGYFADVDDEGQIIENSIKPVKSFNDVQSQEFDYVDVNARTTELSKDVPAWTNAITSTRDVTSARLNPAYKEWLDNTAKAELSSDEKKASVLMDYLDLDYDLDGSKGTKKVSYQKITGYDANTGRAITETVDKEIGHVRMVYKNGKLTPELTDDQKELADAAFKNSIEAKLITETDKQFVAPSQASIKAGRDRRTKEQTFNTIIAALQGDENKFRTLFDPLDQAKASVVDGGLRIQGKDEIDVSTGNTISGAGGRLAAQLGFTAEEFEKYVNKRGLATTPVNEKVSTYETFDTTKSKNILTNTNVNNLNKTRNFDIRGNEIPKDQTKAEEMNMVATSFESKLQEIAIGTGITPRVDKSTGDVTIGGTIITNGINDPQAVLRALQNAIDNNSTVLDGLYEK